LKEAGVPMIGYGQFLTAAVNFLIVAFIIYLLVRSLKQIVPDKDVPQPAEPADVALLREIRDELRQRGAGPAL
jgi:large conductance mechanosensitive channel